MIFHRIKTIHDLLFPRTLKITSTILGIALISSFFISLGTLILLFYLANSRVNQICKMTDGNLRYTLNDNLYQSDDFSQFRQNRENIDSLGKFYNKLAGSSKIKALSVFNQPLQIQAPKGGSSFYYNSEAFLEENKNVDISIKSIQMNKSAFEYYNLEISDGQILPWNTLYKDKNNLPVYLGHSYKGIYAIGDLIKGNFYNRKVTFKIAGFLKENSFIYYQNLTEYYLDDYILVPYPLQCWKIEKDDFIFESILYFSMIYCDLLASDTDTMLQELKSISDSTGFSSFSIIGIDDYQLKYLPILSVIRETQNVLILLFFLLYLVSLFILYGIERFILYSKLELYRAYWIIGDTNFFIFFLYYIGLMYIVGFLISIIFQLTSFPDMPLLLIFLQFIILVSIYSISVCSMLLRNMKNITSQLQS